MDLPKLIQALGIGLSRILRYSYGGFLLFALAALVNSNAATLWKDLPWAVTVLAAIAAGAGIYAIHRNIVIPVHHLGLCFVFWAFETWRLPRKWLVPADKSLSPTRWFKGKLEIRRWERMLAYTTLRRSDFFSPPDKENVDLAHAEQGAVVLTSEVFLAAAVYNLLSPGTPTVKWTWLLIIGLALFFGSYIGAMHQHAFECMQFRKREPDTRHQLQAFLE